MANAIGNIIADSLALGMAYSQRMLTEVQPSQFARMATPGESTITSNHGAFIYGHLALYAPQIITQLGADPGNHQATEAEEALFSKNATCQDDPDGALYPSMDQITQRCNDAYQAALQTLRATDDQVFHQPNPVEGRLKELFPTIGSAHAFYAGGHFMVHMGQMSAWRRMMGLGPA